MCVRSFAVCEGTLDDYIYLEHVAWTLDRRRSREGSEASEVRLANEAPHQTNRREAPGHDQLEVSMSLRVFAGVHVDDLIFEWLFQ